MTKDKVGAEPKKRVKHVFTKDAGIHEGIHRDEPGWYDSNYHCYCFGYGYFFHRGKSLGKNLTPDYIKEHWYNEDWCVGVKDIDTDTVVGINIVSRCTNCGKINSTFVSSDSRFLEGDYVYVTNNKK